MTWSEESMLDTINGDEIKLLSDERVKEYANFPKIDGDYNAGEIYYGNGIKLKTDMEITEFIDRWNFKKYEKTKNTPFKEWKSVRPAEAQRFTKAYPIGYMAGTTERGSYETVKAQLAKEFNHKIEASMQTVYQAGVSQKVWSLANKTALAQFRNKQSKEFKMIKFAMAPTALVLYTGDENQVTKLRKQCIDKFGLVTNRKWPIMEDQSSMRFVPIIKGYINDEEKKEKLFEQLKHQSTSKAGEVKMQFKYFSYDML